MIAKRIVSNADQKQLERKSQDSTVGTSNDELTRLPYDIEPSQEKGDLIQIEGTNSSSNELKEHHHEVYFYTQSLNTSNQKSSSISEVPRTSLNKIQFDHLSSSLFSQLALNNNTSEADLLLPTTAEPALKIATVIKGEEIKKLKSNPQEQTNTLPAAEAAVQAITTCVDFVSNQSEGNLFSASKVVNGTHKAAASPSWTCDHTNLSLSPSNMNSNNFQGVVVSLKDGIFTFSMYGSTNAKDDMGRSYTEFLMRCTYNGSPWLAARRFSEFETLHYELTIKLLSPDIVARLPKFPEKVYFGSSMSVDVVERRRQELETYLAAVITQAPGILKSKQMDQFLGITARIIRIKNKVEGLTQDLGLFTSPGADEVGQDLRLAYPDVEENAIEILVNENWCLEYAEMQRTQLTAEALSDDVLAQLEEEIHQFATIFYRTNGKDLFNAKHFSLSQTLVKILRQWPNLRATCIIDEHSDASLVPRALQLEEDLSRLVNQYYNYVAIYYKKT